MILRSNKNKYYFLSFWLIIVFHLLNNYLWLRQSTDIFGWDVPNHLFFQLKFHRILNFIVSNQYIPLFIKVRQFFKLMNTSMASPDCIYWPNFIYFSSTLISLIFGNSLFIVKLTILVYFLILLFSTYAIAKEVGNKQTGLLAIILVGMYPLIFESSRQYGPDFPLTALVVLSILLLFKTDNFTNTYFSILLGISCGIGMLIKGQFILFFIWPLMVVLFNYFFKENKLSKKNLSNIILFFIIAILISSIWWGNKLIIAKNNLIEHTKSHNKFLEGGTVETIFSADFYLYHLKTLIFSSMGIIFSIFFFISLFYFIRAKLKNKILLTSWILIPLLLFSLFFMVKHDRFLMPILPGIAVVSALGIQQISNRKLKLSIIFLLITIALWQYYIRSYFYVSPHKKRPLFFNPTSYTTSPRYDFEKLKLTRAAADEIGRDCDRYNNCKIGTVVSAGHISTLEVAYWLYYWNSNLIIWDWIVGYPSFYWELPNFDYLIFIFYKQDGFIWPKGQEFLDKSIKPLTSLRMHRNLRMHRMLPEWNENFNKLSSSESKFYLVKTIEFSNRLCWYIYKRKSP